MKNKLAFYLQNSLKNCFFFIVFLFLSVKLVLAAPQPLGTLEGFKDAYEPKGVGASDTITLIFSNLFAVLTIVGGIIFIVQFILGAIGWISSSGKPEKVQKAQDKMINAIIGLIALVAAYGLAYIIGTVLGIDILDPAKYIVGFWN
ncbi:pilin [Patescibacteria group bacterium]